MTKARKAGLVALVTGGLLLGAAGAASAAEAQPQSLLNAVPGISTVSEIPLLKGVAG